MLLTAGQALESLSAKQSSAESFVVWIHQYRQFSDDKLSFPLSELAEYELKALAF